MSVNWEEAWTSVLHRKRFPVFSTFLLRHNDNPYLTPIRAIWQNVHPSPGPSKLGISQLLHDSCWLLHPRKTTPSAESHGLSAACNYLYFFFYFYFFTLLWLHRTCYSSLPNWMVKSLRMGIPSAQYNVQYKELKHLNSRVACRRIFRKVCEHTSHLQKRNCKRTLFLSHTH